MQIISHLNKILRPTRIHRQFDSLAKDLNCTAPVETRLTCDTSFKDVQSNVSLKLLHDIEARFLLWQSFMNASQVVSITWYKAVANFVTIMFSDQSTLIQSLLGKPFWWIRMSRVKSRQKRSGRETGGTTGRQETVSTEMLPQVISDRQHLQKHVSSLRWHLWRVVCGVFSVECDKVRSNERLRELNPTLLVLLYPQR